MAGVEQHQLGRTIQQRRHGPQQRFLGQALWLFPLQLAGHAAEGARVEVAAEQNVVAHLLVVAFRGLSGDPIVELGYPILGVSGRIGLDPGRFAIRRPLAAPLRRRAAELLDQGFPPLPPLGQKPLPALANDCR